VQSATANVVAVVRVDGRRREPFHMDSSGWVPVLGWVPSFYWVVEGEDLGMKEQVRCESGIGIGVDEVVVVVRTAAGVVLVLPS